jgi:hypothetical protein
MTRTGGKGVKAERARVVREYDSELSGKRMPRRRSMKWSSISADGSLKALVDNSE